MEGRREDAPLFSKGIFRREATAWVVLVAYTGVLYSTLTLTDYLYRAVFDEVGKAMVSRGIWAAAALAGLVLVVFVWRRLQVTPATLATVAASGFIVVYSMALETVPANRIHFFQYCPLAILVLEAVRFRIRDRNVYLWSFLLVALIGVGDELVQEVLPERRFDPHDVVLNAVAGVLALAFVGFVVREENYPWGRKGD